MEEDLWTHVNQHHVFIVYSFVINIGIIFALSLPRLHNSEIVNLLTLNLCRILPAVQWCYHNQHNWSFDNVRCCAIYKELTDQALDFG